MSSAPEPQLAQAQTATADQQQAGTLPQPEPQPDSRFAAYGWTPEQVEALREAGVLDAAVAAAERAMLVAAERMLGSQSSTASTPPPTAQQPVQQQQQQQDDFSLPRLTKSELRKQLQRLNQELAYVKSQVAYEQSRRLSEQIDEYFSRLGDEWSDVYGKGRYDRLPPEHKQARDEVVRAASVLLRLYPDSPIEDLLERARYAQHGHMLYRKAAKAAAADIAKAREGQYLSAVSDRRKSPSQVDKAIQIADQLIKKLKTE